MSQQTLDAIDAAVRAHVAEEEGNAMALGWVVCAEMVDPDDMQPGVSSMIVVAPDTQSGYLTSGLLHQGLTAGAPIQE